MEDYLNNLNNLKACYDKVSFEQAMNHSNDELKTLCLNERLMVIRNITSDRLLTSNIINERIKILQERESERVERRREELNKKFSA